MITRPDPMLGAPESGLADPVLAAH